MYFLFFLNTFYTYFYSHPIKSNFQKTTTVVLSFCHPTATVNNLLREGQTVNTRASIRSKSVLFTTSFTHFCFCGGGSDVLGESDKGYFSPMLSCCFAGSFVWLRGLDLSVLRGIRGTFEYLWTLDCSHTCVCARVCVWTCEPAAASVAISVIITFSVTFAFKLLS